MKTRLKSLRLLVGVRRREGERLESALAQARRELAQREQEVADAQGEHAACTADTGQAHADLDAMMNGAFTPAAVRAHGFRVEDLKAAEARALRELGQRRLAAEQQAAAVGSAQAARRRNDQRVASFQERIDDLLRAHDAAQEERAEEETEEASIARHVARSRAAREAACEAGRRG
jgi:hypothetical protein